MKSHSVAVKADGTVVAWGNNYHGQCDVPEGLTDVNKVYSYWDHTLCKTMELLRDGDLITGVKALYGMTLQVLHPQQPVPSFHLYSKMMEQLVPGDGWKAKSGRFWKTWENKSGVAAGHEHLAVIKEDGTVAVWGYNQFGQSIDPNSFTGIKDIESAFSCSNLKEDGTVLVWGDDGTAIIPITDEVEWNYIFRPEGLTGIEEIDAGFWHVLALMEDNTVIAWGENLEDSEVPEGLRMSNKYRQEATIRQH